MSTRKLYYEDCHLHTFSAQVLSCTPRNNRWAIQLDATAFYPEGGGQPCDLGTLDGIPVVDVQEDADTVLHFTTAPLPAGRMVNGCVDYAHRFDLMQQHSGEHIVSGLICSRFHCHNVGFHIGKTLITIDFDACIPPESLSEIEQAANHAIWENRPVLAFYPERNALSCIAYRSKRQLDWPVRLVEIPDCDRCACCGVHVSTTGEIGLVKLLSCVRFHNGVRIEMVAGGRALAYLSAVYDQNLQVSQAFSAQILETGDAARQKNAQLAAEKFRSAGLQKRIFAVIAAGFANQGNVLHFEDALPPTQVRELCNTIAAHCGGIAAVFSPAENGTNYCLISRTDDLRELNRALTAALGGRGGGRADCQQGNVCGTRAEIENFFNNRW